MVFFKKARDRAHLAQKIGKKIELKCTHCNKTAHYHLNDLRAVKNSTYLLTLLGIMMAATAILVLTVGKYLGITTSHYVIVDIAIIITVPFTIYLGLTSTHRQKVSEFNAFRVD